MPPRRGRSTRAAWNEETEVTENVDDAQTSVENGVDEVSKENGVAETNTPNSVTDPKEPIVPQVNGKPAPKSAAQKKREKRKQRKREGSVAASEISDTESVYLLVI